MNTSPGIGKVSTNGRYITVNFMCRCKKSDEFTVPYIDGQFTLCCGRCRSGFEVLIDIENDIDITKIKTLTLETKYHHTYTFPDLKNAED